MNTPRWNTANVKEWLTENKPGFQLIGEYTTGVAPKITVKCENDHIKSVFWATFRTSIVGCKLCVRQKQRLTYEEVKSRFDERGLVLLATEYLGSNIPLEYICLKGHRTTITLGNLMSGQGCRPCLDLLTAARTRLSPSDVTEELIEYGIEVLSDYVDSKTKMSLVCPAGHNYFNNLSKVRRGVTTGTYGCETCHRLKLREVFSGSNGPNWKGGISEETQRVRASAEYNDFRVRVYVRDHNKCVICNKRGERVHHLESFAKNPVLRLDDNNAVVLCCACHDSGNTGSFHNTYGTNHNTREQFEDYLAMRGVTLTLPTPIPSPIILTSIEETA